MRRLCLVVLAIAAACGGRTDLDVAVDEESTEPEVDASTADARAIDASIDASTDVEVSDAEIADAHDAGDASVILDCIATSTMTLATIDGAVEEVTAHGGFVYFHTATGIWRVPKRGGAPILMALPFTTLGWPKPFAVDDFGITSWKIASGGASTSIYRVPIAGGSVTTLATLTGEMWGAVSAGSGAADFWNGTALYGIDVLGTVNEISGTMPTYTSDLFVDDSGIYTASEQGVTHLDNGTFESLAPGFALALAIDETDVYFETGDSSGNRTIAQVAKTGGSTTQLLAAADYLLQGIVVDASHLYVAMGTVLRMNKDGSAQTVVGTGSAGTRALSVSLDDRCVYWAEGATTVTNIKAAPK